MSGIWTGAFWKATAERAIATTAQAAIPVWGIGVPVFEIDFAGVASMALSAGALSVIKSVATTARTGSPSLGGGEQLPRRAGPVDTRATRETPPEE